MDACVLSRSPLTLGGVFMHFVVRGGAGRAHTRQARPGPRPLAVGKLAVTRESAGSGVRFLRPPLVVPEAWN